MSNEKVVFVVDEKNLDINCARLVSEPSRTVRTVSYKHSRRGVAVHSQHCHDTLDAAKAALIEYIESQKKNIESLEYDADNFWVA